MMRIISQINAVNMGEQVHGTVTEEMRGQIALMLTQIELADAVVVGCGSGMSSAAGYDHYHWSGTLADALALFRERYGFGSPFDGFYHCFSTPGEQWAYTAAYICAMADAPAGAPYLDLRALLSGKPTFILATNVDMQCAKAFGEDEICAFQGDFAYLQCAQPCHDARYDAVQAARAMVAGTRDFAVPDVLIPRCPECGWRMTPWMRDDAFLEEAQWHAARARYEAFLRRHVLGGARVLLLELGVGDMTPSVIKFPFWQMAAKNKNVHHITVNRREARSPGKLANPGLYISGGIAEILAEARRMKEEHHERI